MKSSLSSSRKLLNHRTCFSCRTSVLMASAGRATQQVQAVNRVLGGCQGELADTSLTWANGGDAQLDQLLSGKRGLSRDVISADLAVVMMR